LVSIFSSLLQGDPLSPAFVPDQIEATVDQQSLRTADAVAVVERVVVIGKVWATVTAARDAQKRQSE
jgi:hypothetical protein